ncbi:TetR/AcrR family transcriptional regulator [Cellulomonas aerilata]|uniref:TetR family transcriptional regulator n=1 Tax=Cellulomonas aerilata TaxID=515326 RepID=A0A512D961_9CELL|nr:TetR-like C-terminal domain-containing protein [Cellulomonas aerilata]GEO33026.1 TetR family transcriptional regulator [Cellulomonas aerilata]
MPAPERTSLEAVVTAGRAVLEADGVAGLTMQAVAARVGVRAPSLYKRVADRDHLVRLVAAATVEALGERLAAVPDSGDAVRDLAALAGALRAFARSAPAGYGLIFVPGPAAARPDREALARASAPVLRVAAALAGPADALPAARTVTAWAHGFITMELAGAFALGGDVDEAFAFGVRRLAAALAGPDAGAGAGGVSRPR